MSSLSWLLPGCDALGLAHGLLLRLDALVDVSRPQMPTEPPLCASALSCSQRSPPRSGPLCLQALIRLLCSPPPPLSISLNISTQAKLRRRRSHTPLPLTGPYAKLTEAPAAPPFIKVAQTLPGRAVGATPEPAEVATVRPTVLRMLWPLASALVTREAQRAAREGIDFGRPSTKALSSFQISEPVASADGLGGRYPGASPVAPSP